MDLKIGRRRRIYLMRHGEVAYFDGSGKPFRPDEVPLTDHGRRQAQSAGQLLREIPIDRVMVSPLARTLETAKLVLADRDIPVESRDELREIAPGKLRDLPADPAEFQAVFTQAFGVTLKPTDTFLGGESFDSLLERVNRGFDQILADNGWENLLIVAHGGVNRAILTRALASGLEGFGRLEQDPACVNILDIDASNRLLVRMINFSPTNPVKEGHRLTTMEELLARFLGLDPLNIE